MELPRPGPIWTAIIIGLMLVCFAAISFTAVLGKSATYDEPLHFVGGLTLRYEHDFRINPEDPALFGWWASLPLSRSDLKLDVTDPFYEGTASQLDQRWWFVVESLYRLGARNADRLLNASRTLFIVVGVSLGALIACWAYQIDGAWAAIFASVLFCFDPNFLAHAALIKNDVPFSLMMCLTAFFIWRFGNSGGWYWMMLAALACAVAFNVKLSAVLLGPTLVLLLAARAALPTPWKIGKRILRGRQQRAAVVVAGVLVTVVAVYLTTWFTYDFRYSMTANGQVMQEQGLLKKSVNDRDFVRYQKGQLGQLTDEQFSTLVKDQVENKAFSLPVKVDLWMQAHRLLPEAWLYGFLFTYSYSLMRSSYLLGQVGLTGWWYYFPLTIVFKSAIATLAAMLLVPVFLLAARWFRREDDDVPEDRIETTVPLAPKWWTVIVLSFPPAIYFFTVMTANLNLGVRHILPVYPFLFIALGVGTAALIRRWPAATLTVAAVLAVGLIAETANAYPNYLAFFNLACGGPVGGFRLLGDSNLDWGQDLPALAAWQKSHPDEKLYLCYFGMADPTAYGINFTNLPGGWPFLPASALNADEPGVIAISATNLQGIYLGERMTQAYHAALQGEKPFRILNGSIYLFSWPPRNSR
jgi:hypothetical protein